MFYAQQLWGTIVGLMVTVFLGFFVNPFRKWATEKLLSHPAPTGIGDEEWMKTIKPDSARASSSLGLLERILFFSSLALAIHEGIAMWLVFKVAAKWESWNNIIKVPNDFGQSSQPVDGLRARNAWGTYVLSSFLIGTIANILAALGGFVVLKIVSGSK